jgi:hypothetical protein
MPECSIAQSDHYQAPHELGSRQLPADQHGVVDAEFEHQIGRGELEAIGAIHRLPCGSLDRANATAG